jgi:hypothetical protein
MKVIVLYFKVAKMCNIAISPFAKQTGLSCLYACHHRIGLLVYVSQQHLQEHHLESSLLDLSWMDLFMASLAYCLIKSAPSQGLLCSNNQVGFSKLTILMLHPLNKDIFGFTNGWVAVGLGHPSDSGRVQIAQC